MQQMRNCVMDLNPPPPPPIFVASGWERVSFFIQVWCVEWTIQCSLSTWTVDSRLSMQVFGRGGVQSNGSHGTPDMFANSTSLLSHMLWQMLSSFHLYIWAKGEELYLSK
jgi:uncharacterized membrane protein YccF (DUF307 family)